MELADVMAQVLVRGVAEPLERGAVGPRDAPVGIELVHSLDGILEEIAKLLLLHGERARRGGCNQTRGERHQGLGAS